ncbi:MAG: hypothetical protein R3B13_08150 [Polyangiaceae bacterium]
MRLALGFGLSLLLASSTALAAGERSTGGQPRGPDPHELTDSMLGPYVRPPYQGDAESDERPDYEVVERPGPRHHGGFYLRLAGGIGYASDGIESQGKDFKDVNSGAPTAFDARASGFAFATEIAVGFTPISGFVINAGVYTATMPSSTSSSNSVGRGDYEFALTQLALFAPGIDYYIWPTGGLHVQAAFGLSTIVMGQAYPAQDGDDARSHVSTGPGFMLGVGHEWFVGDEWSLGLGGRFLYAWGSGTDPESVGWDHHSYAPTLMVTATYH